MLASARKDHSIPLRVISRVRRPRLITLVEALINGYHKTESNYCFIQKLLCAMQIQHQAAPSLETIK